MPACFGKGRLASFLGFCDSKIREIAPFWLQTGPKTTPLPEFP
jgi:hypothetical protein